MKLSSANNDETKEDFISTLPDALLTQILSLLPDADGCRTSVLSKRWKHLWMFYVIIRSYPTIEQANEYYDFVDKTLAIRKGMPIQRFILHCKVDCDLKRVYDWLRIVVQCGVQVLRLKFCCDCNGRDPPELYILESCWGFFKTCNTLVELTLEGEFELDVPKDEVLFPSMKKISLVGIQYSGDTSFENLITGCPVLEELYFTRHLDDLIRLNVSSTSLKRLRIHADATSLLYWGCKVTIDAPNLEYLYIMDEVESNYSFTVKPLSLVEAYIHTNTTYADQIVTNISAAKVLTLTSSTTGTFDFVDEVYEFNEVDASDEVNDLNVLRFPNLVKLVIDIQDIPNWRLLVILLRKMPKLEHITFLNSISACLHDLRTPLQLHLLPYAH
ncbi:F-box/RNI-like superfamily protein [Tanacetum coccineum]